MRDLSFPNGPATAPLLLSSQLSSGLSRTKSFCVTVFNIFFGDSFYYIRFGHNPRLLVRHSVGDAEDVIGQNAQATRHPEQVAPECVLNVV